MLSMTNLVEVGDALSIDQEDEFENMMQARTQKTQEIITVSPIVYGEKRLNSTGKGQNAKVTFQTSHIKNGEFLTHEEMRKLSSFYLGIGFGRLSSASNYKTSEQSAVLVRSPQTIKPQGFKHQLPSTAGFKRVTSAYSTNNRQRGVPLAKGNTKDTMSMNTQNVQNNIRMIQMSKVSQKNNQLHYENGYLIKKTQV